MVPLAHIYAGFPVGLGFLCFLVDLSCFCSN